MVYNISNFEQVISSEGVSGTVQVSDGSLGLSAANGVTISAYGDITANAFFGYTGTGGGGGSVGSLQQVTDVGSTTTNKITINNSDVSLDASGNIEAQYYIGNANLLSNIVNSDITPGTYGSGTQIPQFVIDSEHRISSITSVPVSGGGGSVGTLQDVSDTGNTTSNTIQFTNSDVSLVTTGNVEVQGMYLGNANLLSNIVNSDVGPATYGNTTHVTQITISDTGRITGVSNVEIQELSNLDQVVNRGNITSNTVQFTNTHTALVTDLTSNVGIKIDQLSSVNITSLEAEQGLLYDGTNWVNDYSVRNFTKIKNKTGDTLYQGNTVYIVDGHNTNVANVALADATDSSKMPAIGLVFADIADQGEGLAVTYGKVQNVDTDNFIEGETVYVSNTQTGGFSNIKPTTNGELIQNVGIVVKSDPAHGVVFVTGVGRTNDIPNGTVTTEQSDMLYIYGETASSRFAKITPQNFRSNLDQVVNTGNVTTNVLQIGGLYSTGNVETLDLFLGNANLLSNIVNSDVGPATYGNATHVTQITISDTGRITGVSNVEIQELSNLDQVVDRGNVTTNVLQTGGLYSTGNVETLDLFLGNANLLSNIVNSDVGPATYGNATHVTQITISDTGRITGVSNVEIQELSNLDQVVDRGNVTTNVLQTGGLYSTGNVETLDLFLGNANLLSNIVNSDVGPATYGNATHVTQITISDTGRITGVSNVEIQELSNLDQVMTRGNVTSSNITTTGQANVANIYVSQSVGASPTVSSNIITVDQAGHSYKFFRFPTYTTGSLEGIKIQNATDGCQTLVDIYPIAGDLDVFQNFSNGGDGPTTVLTTLNSNLIINTGNHVMISCVTDLSNTFVNITGFY